MIVLIALSALAGYLVGTITFSESPKEGPPSVDTLKR